MKRRTTIKSETVAACPAETAAEKPTTADTEPTVPVTSRRLFGITFLLSACTFGGGFVIISMMKKKLVEELHWLKEDEMLDMTAIAQSSPGALAVNISVAAGYRLKGLKGALTCILGTIIPPLIIISLLSLCYDAFRENTYVALALQVMRAGVAAVIFDVVVSLAAGVIKTRRLLWILLMLVCFIAVFFFDVSAILIILICGFIGLMTTVRRTAS